MTLGDKLKEARKQFGLSQVDLAKKLCVSRAAVAKWETNKGLPDIMNLKAIASLFQVSIDYLLDNGDGVDKFVTKVSYNLKDYGKGRKKVLKDKVIRAYYPDADIHTLIPRQKASKEEIIVDNALALSTIILSGVPIGGVFDLVNSLKLLKNEYYLVNYEDYQLFVVVGNESIESHRVAKKINQKRFVIGNLIFINCGPIVYA